MSERFKRYGSGDQLSAGDLNKQAEAAERQGAVFGVSGFNRKSFAGGESVTPGPGDSIWILILDGGGGSGSGCGSGMPGAGSGSGPCLAAYDWAQVFGKGCGATQPGDLLQGDACKFPATEINGNISVPAGSIHRAWFRGDGTGLDFDSSGVSSGGGFTRIRVVTNWCASGAGSGS